MLATITMQKQANILYLNGILDCHTLETVWSEHSHLLRDINCIDVTKLTRVDSSGLALLTYLCIEYNAKLANVTMQLKTLIELYDLEPVVLN